MSSSKSQWTGISLALRFDGQLARPNQNEEEGWSNRLQDISKTLTSLGIFVIALDRIDKAEDHYWPLRDTLNACAEGYDDLLLGDDQAIYSPGEQRVYWNLHLGSSDADSDLRSEAVSKLKKALARLAEVIDDRSLQEGMLQISAGLSSSSTGDASGSDHETPCDTDILPLRIPIKGYDDVRTKRPEGCWHKQRSMELDIGRELLGLIESDSALGMVLICVVGTADDDPLQWNSRKLTAELVSSHLEVSSKIQKKKCHQLEEQKQRFQQGKERLQPRGEPSGLSGASGSTASRRQSMMEAELQFKARAEQLLRARKEEELEISQDLRARGSVAPAHAPSLV